MCDAHTLPKDPVGRSPLSLLSESACLNPHEGCPFFQALGACEAMPWSQDQEWVIRLAVGGRPGRRQTVLASCSQASEVLAGQPCQAHVTFT